MFVGINFLCVVFKRENALDQIVLAGREGVSLIWYEQTELSWKTLNLGTGLPQTPGNPYWGSGSGEFRFFILLNPLN
jgi:hypothetical protein